jgi:hypothetical protein
MTTIKSLLAAKAHSAKIWSLPAANDVTARTRLHFENA